VGKELQSKKKPGEMGGHSCSGKKIAFRRRPNTPSKTLSWNTIAAMAGSYTGKCQCELRVRTAAATHYATSRNAHPKVRGFGNRGVLVGNITGRKRKRKKSSRDPENTLLQLEDQLTSDPRKGVGVRVEKKKTGDAKSSGNGYKPKMRIV